MSLYSNLTSLDIKVLIRAVDSTTAPLIITDNLLPDNPIVYANQAFLDLCGYSENEMIGKNCRLLQGVDTEPGAITRLHKAVVSNTDARVNIKNYRKDGSPFWNDLVISPIKNDVGQTTHFMGMQLDITDRIKQVEELKQARLKLEQSNQELEEFTYAASHDLQEPLRMVSSYLQLLEKRYGKAFDDDAKVFIAYAVEGANRMQSLINDLLTLSRVSTTAKKFKLVSFSEIINRAQFNLKLLLDETHAKIVVSDLPQLPADSVQMVQLLQNLIANAVKYRRPGVKPVIKISAIDSGDHYEFSVADNGIGIEPQYFSRIFNIFQRLHTRDEYPGTGVGLTICNKIIERHHGELWVQSNSPHGSVFKFRLPKIQPIRSADHTIVSSKPRTKS